MRLIENSKMNMVLKFSLTGQETPFFQGGDELPHLYHKPLPLRRGRDLKRAIDNCMNVGF